MQDMKLIRSFLFVKSAATNIELRYCSLIFFQLPKKVVHAGCNNDRECLKGYDKSVSFVYLIRRRSLMNGKNKISQ